ncbi:hypothetical protein, partial [Paenibacillus dendritiformis]
NDLIFAGFPFLHIGVYQKAAFLHHLEGVGIEKLYPPEPRAGEEGEHMLHIGFPGGPMTDESIAKAASYRNSRVHVMEALFDDETGYRCVQIKQGNIVCAEACALGV